GAGANEIVGVAELATPKATAEEVVAAIGASVESRRIVAVERLHAARKPAGSELQDEVVVVVHQAVREHAPVVSLRQTLEHEEKQQACVVGGVDIALVVPARPDVV